MAPGWVHILNPILHVAALRVKAVVNVSRVVTNLDHLRAVV